MAQPGSLGNQIPKSEDWMVRAIRDLERKVDQMAAARSLAASAIGGGSLQSGNYDAGDTGWALNGDDNLEVNDITLRGGIIGNDALSSPVDGSYSTGSIGPNGYASGGNTVAFTYSLAKPVGFVKGILNFGISASAQNTTAAADYLYLGAIIDGVPAGQRYQPYSVGEFNTMIYYSATLVNVAPDETSVLLQITAGVLGATAWAEQSSNNIYSTCTAVWLR